MFDSPGLQNESTNIHYGGAIDMFLSFLEQPATGGLSQELVQEVIQSSVVSDFIDYMHDQTKRLLKCGSQNHYSDKEYDDDFQPKGINWAFTGKWQLSLVGRCDWQCGLHTDKACKCCTCKYTCKIIGLVSKHYTFFYTKDGNPKNKYTEIPAVVAEGLLGAGDYYISQSFSISFSEGGVSHCEH
jgi:hypothetical protein